ncbi:hypothetical protein P5624_00155 (plasmid) [Bacillus subtilis]|uniref:hypothetical protein n=1 Tax=Bacillus subtilis group TaxID=653685 RepID=UPI000849EEFE|nr:MULTISPECIES: hypothetical protein [Bacillus subtilis group]MCY9367504.1 hypothetical protein [Bacillus spizizenii]MCY9311643.1 hypothetical protein [Bacillus inaquosorum]ODV47889.1 hypothetical protein BCM26_05635 [Bacillus subtilis]OJH63487.1 hypothetical protein BOH71_09575 [Bacillus subtilis]WEY90780.1 hypothetical protein P5624_00155 [Bacillus subtilis]
MKDFISIIMIIYIGFFVVVSSCYYFTQEYRHKAIVLTMTESAKSASINSFDKSVRVERGKAEITEKSFKEKFEELFKQNSNVKLKSTKYSYSFLKREDGGIKAVRVKITDERKQTYQVTLVSDIAS